MTTQETESARAALASILAPLNAQRERLLTELTRAETLVRGLRDELKTVERVLRAADPENAPGPKSKPKNDKPPGGKSISDESLALVLGVLKADPERYGPAGEGFTATGLWRDQEGALQMSPQTVGVALGHLRERDQIRLVRRGTGGSRIYKLVV